MYEFAGSKSAKLVVREYGKLVARILQLIALPRVSTLINPHTYFAGFAVFYKMLFKKKKGIFIFLVLKKGPMKLVALYQKNWSLSVSAFWLNFEFMLRPSPVFILKLTSPSRAFSLRFCVHAWVIKTPPPPFPTLPTTTYREYSTFLNYALVYY